MNIKCICIGNFTQCENEEDRDSKEVKEKCISKKFQEIFWTKLDKYKKGLLKVKYYKPKDPHLSTSTLSSPTLSKSPSSTFSPLTDFDEVKWSNKMATYIDGSTLSSSICPGQARRLKVPTHLRSLKMSVDRNIAEMDLNKSASPVKDGYQILLLSDENYNDAESFLISRTPTEKKGPNKGAKSKTRQVFLGILNIFGIDVTEYIKVGNGKDLNGYQKISDVQDQPFSGVITCFML